MSQAYNEWERSSPDNFWSGGTPSMHVVQVYESDTYLLNALAGFVGDGINTGDSIIVIATKQHLDALNERLSSFGIHVAALVADDRYIPLDAEETLAKFMVDGWPSEELFRETVLDTIRRATKGGRRVRAFGEMVALLWADGHMEATLHLEQLWNRLQEDVGLCLFCAYPQSSVTGDTGEAVKHICSAHSHLLNGHGTTLKELQYQALCGGSVTAN